MLPTEMLQLWPKHNLEEKKSNKHNMTLGEHRIPLQFSCNSTLPGFANSWNHLFYFEMYQKNKN